MALISEPLTWDVTKSAPLHSQLSGVLAGFAFATICLLLARQIPAYEEGNPSRQRRSNLSRQTVGELFVAFLALAVAALEWGIIAGEGDLSQLRARIAALFATLTLAVGAVQMVLGICYLVLHFDSTSPPDENRTNLSMSCTYGYVIVSSLAAFHIGLTASDTVSVGLSGKEFSPSEVWYILPFLAAMSVVAALGPGFAKKKAGWISRLQSSRTMADWFLNWYAVGVLAVYGVVAFSIAVNDSNVAMPGSWSMGDADAVFYMLMMSVGALATMVLFVIRGWSLQQVASRVSHGSADR